VISGIGHQVKVVDYHIQQQRMPPAGLTARRLESAEVYVDARDEFHVQDFQQYLYRPVQPPCSQAYLKKCWHLETFLVAVAYAMLAN
jgi:hypothetical protein